jgi:hypothetical protein
MGGERATDTERNAPRKNTYFFDPSSSNQWTETDSLHFARNGMAASVLNNKIYAAGGSGGPGGPPPNGPPPVNNQPPASKPGDPGPPGNRPRPENNRPVDMEIFNLK